MPVRSARRAQVGEGDQQLGAGRLQLGQGFGDGPLDLGGDGAVQVAGEAGGPGGARPAGGRRGRAGPKAHEGEARGGWTESRRDTSERTSRLPMTSSSGTGTLRTVGRVGRSAWARPARYRV